MQNDRESFETIMREKKIAETSLRKKKCSKINVLVLIIHCKKKLNGLQIKVKRM